MLLVTMDWISIGIEFGFLSWMILVAVCPTATFPNCTLDGTINLLGLTPLPLRATEPNGEPRLSVNNKVATLALSPLGTNASDTWQEPPEASGAAQPFASTPKSVVLTPVTPSMIPEMAGRPRGLMILRILALLGGLAIPSPV